ncbi:Uncharacterized protein BM_BM9648 [Brugia malayi]|uniref:Bm9648 n=1 Tax=Brugia malayi TaxID=6279 RepID=A0A0H5BRV9_BRUMA|nr:Uncharacterized protein BM_BM9648 [Brugia malayi]CDP94884.1 Bm9648 [Brugia malayi]VIO86829.1 Uncharacterized protein BM_BM9648 [Brugia malayi]
MLTPILTRIHLRYVNASNNSPGSCYKPGLSAIIVESAQTAKEKLEFLNEVKRMNLTPLDKVLTKKKIVNSTRPEKELGRVNAPQAVLSHSRSRKVDGMYLSLQMRSYNVVNKEYCFK